LGLNDFIRENNLNRQWKYNVFGDVWRFNYVECILPYSRFLLLWSRDVEIFEITLPANIITIAKDEEIISVFANMSYIFDILMIYCPQWQTRINP
jgi:hypothetical protein